MELNTRVFGSDKATGTVSVSEESFNREFNEALVHQVINAYLSYARAGTHAQKTRSEVSGGGIKPFRQKGTGRARAGTTRGPLWRKGGVTFAAKPSDYSQKVNKKMYRGALRCIMSELMRQERLIVLEDLQLTVPKTKELLKHLKSHQLNDVLIVKDELDENLYLASRNLKDVCAIDVRDLNPVSLLKYSHVVMTVPALKQVEELLK